MTKRRFIHEVTSGTLSANKVLTKLTEELYIYEKKYNMRSEVFYNLIVGTPAEETPDFINWAICYRSYFRTLQSKFPLKELSSVLWKTSGSTDYWSLLVNLQSFNKCLLTIRHIFPWLPILSWICPYILWPSDKAATGWRVCSNFERRIWVQLAQTEASQLLLQSTGTQRKLCSPER